MPITNDNILHNLGKMRLKKSVCLSVDEKAGMLRSVMSAPRIAPIPQRIPSPFMSMFTQYAVYALPAFILGFIGVQYGQSILSKSKFAYDDFNKTRAELELSKTSLALRDSLIKTQEDISTLKTFQAINGNNASADSEKEVLVSQVSSGSKSIRNQVAALVKENKIAEAKKVVLTLETALKADELYKVAPAVQTEVTAATDLRVKLEKKETLATVEASSTASTSIAIADRLSADRQELEDLEVKASADGAIIATSTADLIADANKYLDKAGEYLKNKDAENAIISLQIYDRTVAEAKLILLK